MDKEQIMHLASLAKLSLSAAEIDVLKTDLSRIVSMVDMINQADEYVKKLPSQPTTPNAVHQNACRSDIVKPSLDSKEIEKLAPQFSAGHIVVPVVLDQ